MSRSIDLANALLKQFSTAAFVWRYALVAEF